MQSWSRWAAIAALTLVAASCGKDNNTSGTQCTSTSDCGVSQTCSDGMCVASSNNGGECNGDPDCPGGFTCNDEKVCVQTPLSDMGNTPEDMGTPEEDMNFDNIPPEVVSTTPDGGAVDVPLDSTFTVVFNERLRETSVNIQSIEIRDPANNVVPADIAYDDATLTATVTPQSPLRPATPYRGVVTVFVRDRADNALIEEVEAKFYTVYDEPAGIRAIAEKWAPHIYQAIGDSTGGAVNVDLPTTVDFDSNLKARDNRSKSRLATTRNTASVYYNVLETKTHYLALYAMYYPVRNDGQMDFEHDFTGAVIVVDKASDSVVLVDGVKVQTGADTNLGFKPSGGVVDGVGQPQQLRDFDPASMEGTHFPMFIPSGEHEACAFPVGGNPPYCLHNSGEFPGEGLLLKPGATGQKFADAVDAVDPLYGGSYKEMTYQLVPLPSTLWARRTDVGSEQLWQATQTYTPSGTDRPETTSGGSPIIIPTLLVSDDATTYGKAPFQWLRTSTESNNGQWLIDPAYLLLNKYDFGDTWSQEYCFNVFLDVNLRGDAANPECGTD